MLKFMKHQQKLTPERIQKQKELFAYTKPQPTGSPSMGYGRQHGRTFLLDGEITVPESNSKLNKAVPDHILVRMAVLASPASVASHWAAGLLEAAKACQHGFPTRPSALAYDPELKLLAVATKSASITVYGAPGVEFYGQHESHDHAVTFICFVPGKGELVTLCADNSLHLWRVRGDGSPNSGQLQLKRSTTLEGKLKRISVLSCCGGSSNLLVGTEGGNIYLCNLASFTFSDNIIYQDVVMQNVPEAFKVNPGSVESLCQHPTHPGRVLIGYHRGLSVLWDMPSLTALQTYVSSQQLENMSWHPDGSKFISCHNDGSITIWPSDLPASEDSAMVNGDEASKQPDALDGPNTVYGPFPCKPINKVDWRRAKGGGDLLVLSGGMQRASHGDRHTVSVMNYSSEADADTSNDMHVTFSLSSRVIDYCVTDEIVRGTDEKTGEETEDTVAGCLVILCEEEVVFIDLCLPEWPALPLPYLCSLHCSAITATALACNPSPAVYNKIRAAGLASQSGLSTRPFPVTGGVPAPGTAPSPDTPQDMLVTGHEDGTVRVWCGGGVCLSLLHTVHTAALFASDDPPADDGPGAEDDDWPPFRKTGLFDPYSDDPRLAIKKVQLCGLSGQLVAAGTAGQVMVLRFTDSTDADPVKVQAVDVNLVAENDNFVWKSHSKLDLKSKPVDLGVGLELQLLLQLSPPASCTSLHLHSEWGLLACGTAHGFALADIFARKNLLAKSTLSSLDLANAADEGPMSRRKSLKKSLRESFRRLRRGRSQRKTTQAAAHPAKPIPAAASKSSDGKAEAMPSRAEGAAVGKASGKDVASETGHAESGGGGEGAADGGDAASQEVATEGGEEEETKTTYDDKRATKIPAVGEDEKAVNEGSTNEAEGLVAATKNVGVVEGQIKEVVDELVQSAALLVHSVPSPGEKETGMTSAAAKNEAKEEETSAGDGPADEMKFLRQEIEKREKEEDGLIIEDLDKPIEEVKETITVKEIKTTEKKSRGSKMSKIITKGKGKDVKKTEVKKLKVMSQNVTKKIETSVEKTVKDVESGIEKKETAGEKRIKATSEMEKTEQSVEKVLKDCEQKIADGQEKLIREVKEVETKIEEEIQELETKSEKEIQKVETRIEKNVKTLESRVEEADETIAENLRVVQTRVLERDESIQKVVEEASSKMEDAEVSAKKMVQEEESILESASERVMKVTKKKESRIVKRIEETEKASVEAGTEVKTETEKLVREAIGKTESMIEETSMSIKQTTQVICTNISESKKKFTSEVKNIEERNTKTQKNNAVKVKAAGKMFKVEAVEGEKIVQLMKKEAEEVLKHEVGDVDVTPKKESLEKKTFLLEDELMAGSPEEKLEKDMHEQETDKDPKLTSSAVGDVPTFLKSQEVKLSVTDPKTVVNDTQSKEGTTEASVSECSTSVRDPKSGRKGGSVSASSQDSVVHVPFLYYVMPKHFREWRHSSDLERGAREERKLQRLRRPPSIEAGSSDATAGEGGPVCVGDVTLQRATDVEQQRKAGFFSLPRMVDPAEAYATSEAKGKGMTERSPFSLPRFLSPKAMKGEGNDVEDEVPANTTGLARLKNFLLRRDKSESSKSEDSEDSKGDGKDGKSDDGCSKPTKLSSTEVEPALKKETLPKKKRQLFQLGRLTHSEDISSSDSNLANLPKSDAVVPEESKAKTSSLTRPRSLWFGFRDNRERVSPMVSESSPVSVMVTKPSDEPLSEAAEAKNRKQRINFSLKGLTRSKVKEDKPSKADEVVAATMSPTTEEPPRQHDPLQRSPSYEMAVSSRVQHDLEASPKKSVFETGSTKLKQLFKNQSVTLRNPFTRSSTLGDKRKSCPAGALEDGEGPWPLGVSNSEHRSSAPNISDRHPSISTFIDETPVAGSPPVLPSTAPTTASAAVGHPTDKGKGGGHPPLAACVAADGGLDLNEPPHYPPPSIPSSPTRDALRSQPPPLLSADPGLDVESLSSGTSSDNEDSQYDHQPTARADWTQSLEHSLRTTLERKLTFSLPLDAPNSSGAEVDVAVRPVERSIESRQQSADYIGSMVRCLHLSKCFIANSQVMSATLWAGTNSGAIYVFTIAIPPSDKRNDTPVTVQLGKEIHLKHAAPVLSVMILDGSSRPFPPPLAVKKELAPAPDTSAPHKVLICSEEQFKVFTLPQLKPFCKYKLTAIDGSRVRKIGFADFVSSVDANYREPGFTVVSNTGDASVFSLPDCRRQISAPCFKREDIFGINTVVFSTSGEALFFTSPSELMRVSLSAAKITQPRPKLVRPATPAVKGEAEAKALEAAAAAAAPAPAAESNDKVSEKEVGKEGACSVDVDVKGKSEEANKCVDEKDGAEAEAAEHSLEVSEASAASKLEEVNGGDTSLLSGDITIDSIRDHMVVGSNTTIGSNTTLTSQGSSSTVLVTAVSSSSTTTTSTTAQSVSRQTITVVKTSNVVVSSSTTTGEDGVATGEPVPADAAGDIAASEPAVNGTEVLEEERPRKKRGAPLAKVESFFVKNPRKRAE